MKPEARIELARQLIWRVRTSSPKPAHNLAVRRTLFADHPVSVYLDIARTQGADAALRLLPGCRELAAAQLAQNRRPRSPRPNSLVEVVEPEESDYSGGDVNCDAPPVDGLTISPGPRQVLPAPTHWEPYQLTEFRTTLWLPARSEWVTEAERELATIAHLLEKGLSSREISTRLNLSLRLVQRRISYLLNYQPNTDNFVAPKSK